MGKCKRAVQVVGHGEDGLGRLNGKLENDSNVGCCGGTRDADCRAPRGNPVASGVKLLLDRDADAITNGDVVRVGHVGLGRTGD